MGKGNMWPHFCEKYLRLNMLWFGNQISYPVNKSQMQLMKYTTDIYGWHFWHTYDLMNSCKDTHFKWWLQSGIKTCNQTTKVFSQDNKIYLHISLCLYSANFSLILLPSKSNLPRVKHTAGSGQAVNIICISLLVISTSFFVGFQHLKLFAFSIWRSWSKCPIKPPDLWMLTTNKCQDWQVQLGQRGFSSQCGFH